MTQQGLLIGLTTAALLASAGVPAIEAADVHVFRDTARVVAVKPDRREYREEHVGYRVKFRYNGQTFWTRTHRHPGDRIPVRVSVEPAHPR